MMVDLHSHMLYGVDDGARNIEESLEMITRTYMQGVTDLYLTPHSYAVPYHTVERTFDTLQKEVKKRGLPIKLYLGCEVNCYKEDMDHILNQLERGIYFPLNQTKYVLTEFDSWITYEEVLFCIDRLQKAQWIPVIAHVERYDFCNVERVQQLKSLGCYIQINLYSVEEETKKTTKENARALLKAKLVDFVGSDAHRISHRPPRYERGEAYLWKAYEKTYVEQILYQNAADAKFIL